MFSWEKSTALGKIIPPHTSGPNSFSPAATQPLARRNRDKFSPTHLCPLSLTLLEPGGTRRDFLVWIHRGLWSQGVKLLPADHIHFLEVLYFLLHWKKMTMKQTTALLPSSHQLIVTTTLLVQQPQCWPPSAAMRLQYPEGKRAA